MNEQNGAVQRMRINNCNIVIRYTPQANPSVMESIKQILFQQFLHLEICQTGQNVR